MSKSLLAIALIVVLLGGGTGVVFAQEAVSDRELEVLRSVYVVSESGRKRPDSLSDDLGSWF